MERIVGSVLQENPKKLILQVPGDHGMASAAVLQPCTELAAINSRNLDTRLQFQPDGHTYFHKDAKPSHVY